MISVIRKNPLAAILALVFHIALIALLLFGTHWSAKPKQATAKSEPIQATVVDDSKRKAKEKAEAEARRKKAEEKKRQEQKRLAEQKKKKVAEKRRKEEAKRKQAEKKRQAELKKKREAEQKRKAAEKAKAEKKAKVAAEARRKAEAKRKAEAEAKRRAAEEARLKAIAEQKAREEALRAQMRAEHDERETSRYTIAIQQRIEGVWLRPPNTGDGLSCVIKVRLIPGGDIVPGSVAVVETSGNSAFDRSVVSAVYKAAPLPVPSGGLFESFRDLRLVFKPQK